MIMTYRVDLDIYNGPMDLLLYLIRKDEVDIQDIPIGRIAEQYLAYLDFLKSMDINVAGDFLVMAATLMEIKSRLLLPRTEVVAEDGSVELEEDPRLELIRQLLAYKRFRDAADELESLGDQQWRRFSRPPAEVVVGPEDQRYAVDEMMKDVQLWDLLNAFAKVLRSISLVPREVVYDDTPIEDIAQRLLAVMEQRKSALFTEMLEALFAQFQPLNRSHVIGAFLAVLECVRQRLIGIERGQDVAELRVFLREEREEISQMTKAAPPEAFITSREAARQVEGFDRPRGRLSDEVEELHATEFDAELDAIVVPEVPKPKPPPPTAENAHGEASTGDAAEALPPSAKQDAGPHEASLPPEPAPTQEAEARNEQTSQAAPDEGEPMPPRGPSPI